MKWNLNTGQKLRTGASLLVVFILVLATNLVDKNHLQIVQKSLMTVYEDRLVAKNYVYNISRQIHCKQNVSMTNNLVQIETIYRQADDSINTLLDSFATTYLIYQEERSYKSLVANLKKLRDFEKSALQGDVQSQEGLNSEALQQHYLAALEDLDKLSQIQMKEGRREVLHTNKIISTSDLISKIEIAFLIVIGFIFQLIIFWKSAE